MAVLVRPIFGAALLLGLLWSAPAGAVFGGKAPASNDPIAKAVAAIRYQTDDGGVHLCTAVALAPRLVLTAAHCTDGDRGQLRVIFSPTLSAVPADRIRAVTDVARARPTAASKNMYAYQNPDDVALILLAAPAPTGTAFARLAADLPGLATLLVAGYGATSDLRQPDANGHRQLGFDQILRTASAPLLSSGAALLVTDQTTRAGTCTGDSGGPAFATGKGPLTIIGIMVGVASPRAVNDYCRGKAYFAAMPRWRDWIAGSAAAWKQPLP